MKTYDPSRPGDRERFMRDELTKVTRFAFAGENDGARVLSVSASYRCECGAVMRSWRECWEHCAGHQPVQATFVF